jgi:hypothetical protein
MRTSEQLLNLNLLRLLGWYSKHCTAPIMQRTRCMMRDVQACKWSECSCVQDDYIEVLVWRTTCVGMLMNVASAPPHLHIGEITVLTERPRSHL